MEKDFILEKRAYLHYTLYLMLAFGLFALGSWLTIQGIIVIPFSGFVLSIVSFVLLVLLAPLLALYTAIDPEIVPQALITTTVVSAISTYVGLRAKNLSGMRMYLFFALLGYIGALIVSWFIPLPFLTQIGIVIFTCYIAHDVNLFKRHVRATNGLLTQEQILTHVMNQFMNIINLFIKVLRLVANRD